MAAANEPVAPTVSPRRQRIVLTTFGSLGDVHPFLAIALGLKERGHVPIIATSGMYRQKIEDAGIGFHPVRPDLPEGETVATLMPRLMDQRKGGERIIREMLMPALRESYDDLLSAVRGADHLVSHLVTYAAPLVAEKTGIAWTSTMIAPIGFLSSHDPPVLAPFPLLAKLRFLGPRFHRPLFRFLRWWVRSWSLPWHRLRGELGLPDTSRDPIFDQYSPRLIMALFSRLLADRQPDWPPQTRLTGFPFYDQHGAAGLPPALQSFLDAGPAPIVFTLGSSAVMDAGRFYEHSAAAAQHLGRRAVLLIGTGTRNLPAYLPKDVFACEYARFSELFPRAAAIVHQGGVGTTGQAMRSGRPMLVIPYSHDQFDNAARVRALGSPGPSRAIATRQAARRAI